MKKLIIIAIIILLLIFLVLVGLQILMPKGPDLAQFQHLKDPQIIAVPDQKMLAVELKGDPNVVGKQAFGLLFKTFFQIKKKQQDVPMAVPRARWSLDLGTPASEWTGIYAIPLPDHVREIPEQKSDDGLKAELTTWTYGTVAEILHIGPYDKETPTIDRLKAFIAEQGYEITGLHEEEYLKGPGMLLKGNPEKYHTIIRYNVKKKEAKNELSHEEVITDKEKAHSRRKPEFVQSIINKHRPAISDCYKKLQLTNPSWKGRAEVRVAIDPVGRVSSVELVDSTIDESLKSCILAQIRTWNDFGPGDPSAPDEIYRQVFTFGY